MADTKIILHAQHRRPDAASYAPLQGAATSMISDGLGRHGGVGGGIRALTTASRFCGPALTVRCRPNDNLAALVALTHLQPGDVVVIDAAAHLEGAVLGGNYAALVKGRGGVALVADGAARDLEELEALGLPVFARGLTPNGPFKTGPGEVGGRIVLGPVPVQSGDIVVGDPDGVVVVPQARLDAAIDGLRAIQARESEMARTIGGGEIPDWLTRLVEQAEVEKR